MGRPSCACDGRVRSSSASVTRSSSTRARTGSTPSVTRLPGTPATVGPCPVLVVELPGGQGDVAYDRMARQLTDIIRAEARDPDRAVRIGRSRFHLLLPETSGRAAQAAAERLQRAFIRDPGKLVGVPSGPPDRDRHTPPDRGARVRRAARRGSPQDVIGAGPRDEGRDEVVQFERWVVAQAGVHG